MTTRKKTTAGKQARKLKVRKETIRDLDVNSKSKEVKGGCSITDVKATCFVCHTK